MQTINIIKGKGIYKYTYFEEFFWSSIWVRHDELANVVSAVVVPLLLSWQTIK